MELILRLILQTMSNYAQIARQEQNVLKIYCSQLRLLLPHRPLSLSQIDQTACMQLYQALTCSICVHLLQFPVLLRCSHRFCRACIEHRIRSSSKKYCPICQSPLFTKRELRPDDFTMDFIDIVFGNLNCSGETKLQEADINTVIPSQKVRNVRSKRQCRKRPQSYDTEVFSGNLPVKRKKKVDIQIYPQIKYSPDDSFPSESFDEDNQYDVRNTSQIIDNKGDDTIIGTSIKMEEKSIKSKIQQSFESSIDLPDISYQEKNEDTEYDEDDEVSEKEDLFLPHENQSKPFEQVQQSVDKMIKIKLMVHPLKYATPFLPFSQLECQSKARAKCIFDLLAQEFNLLRGEQVELYIQLDGYFHKINQYETLGALRQDYWQSINKNSFFGKGAKLETLSSKIHFSETNRKEINISLSKLILYFSVEVESSLKDVQPSHRLLLI